MIIASLTSHYLFMTTISHIEYGVLSLPVTAETSSILNNIAHRHLSQTQTQTIVYSTLKLQMISKVDILVNHKNIWC